MVRSSRRRQLPELTDAEIELLIAVVRGDIQLTQAAVAMGVPRNRICTLYTRAFCALQQAHRRGHLTIVYTK